MAKLSFWRKGGLVRAVLRTPDGRTFHHTVRAHVPTLAGDELAGGWFKKALKKTAKVALAPVKIAHKITHKGPIEKLHKKIQKQVAKTLPFTKPFISIHNSLASPVHKAIEGKKVRTKVTAAAIAKATKNLPPAQKQAAQAALVLRHKQDEAVADLAKGVALRNVVAKAKAGGPATAKALKARIKKALPKGTYIVTRPDGKVVRVPAAKVATR